MVGLYQQSSGDQSWLFNGSQYRNYIFSFKEGHPFFKIDTPGKGSIVYEGILYNNVLLQYDEVQEKIILEDNNRRIQLLNDKITSFTILDNVFMRAMPDSAGAIRPGPGFFQVLVDGATSLLKKESKMIREEINSQVIERYIEAHPSYYIKKAGLYSTIKSKGSLLSALADRKKEIQQYIRKNHFNFKKDKDNTLTKLVEYYNQLNG